MDLLIRGALVAPGDGEPRRADVALQGDRIAALEPALEVNAASVVEAQGLLLCPGFIDMHAHSALQPFADPRLSAKVGQGFTTELIHPDGLAPAPVSEEGRERRRSYIRPLEGAGPESWTWGTRRRLSTRAPSWSAAGAPPASWGPGIRWPPYEGWPTRVVIISRTGNGARGS